MLNKIIIMGRLTRDPELRRTQTGTAVTSFSLAVDRDFKSQNGEKETDFIDIVAWRGTAEFVSKYFTKGRMAVVEGRLQIRDWTDRDGGKRRSAEVIAENVYFGDSKRDSDKVQAERDAGVAAAQQTVDATRAQLETLRREYAELQRNPSANPANYTVRTSELSMQISDTADALRKAVPCSANNCCHNVRKDSHEA